MDNFRKNKGSGGKKFGGGGRSFGGGRDRGGKKSFGGGRSGGRPEMHSAVCDDCGKRCEVPFRPTGDKPIFCSDCFRNKGNSEGSRDRGRDSRSRFEGKNDNREAVPNYKAQFELLNSKLDKIISVLNPNEVKELNDFVEKTETKKIEKKAKKEVDTKALKKAIKKTSAKKSPTKKTIKKKAVVKKTVTKKKSSK